jgi:hypothetical protein
MKMIVTSAPASPRSRATARRRLMSRRTLAAQAAALATVAALALAPSAASAAPAGAALTAAGSAAARKAGVSDSFSAVSCPSRRMCVAVGGFLAERWTGHRWVRMRLAQPAGITGASLYGVSCSSARACTAVGSGVGSDNAAAPFAERWNGRRWRVQTISASVTSGVPLAAVSCGSKTSCTAVGYYDFNDISFATQTLVEHWDGTGWAEQPTPPAGDAGSDLTSVSCPSAGTCTAAGYYIDDGDEGPGAAPLAMRWQAGTWAIQPTPGNALGNTITGLSAVSCPTATACIAVGSDPDGNPIALRWNGTTWLTMRVRGTSTSPGLTGVSCSSPDACTAVSGGYLATRKLAQRWNGRWWAWQRIRIPRGSHGTGLSAVSCSSAKRCTAVGSYSVGRNTLTLAERWNGRRWAIQRTRNPGLH